MSPRRAVAATTFPAEAACVAAARQWARGWCRRCGVEAAVGDAVQLLVSEIVTNAITHTGTTRIGVRVRVEPHFVEVTVDDADPRPPRPRRAGPADTGGRGLTLVDALADAWGTRRLGPGKQVWFRIARA